MGAILLLSLLPMALVFGLFDGDDDDTLETNDEELPGEKMQVIEDEPLTGTEGSDTITGTDEADTVSGGAGDDNIYLGAGDDMGDEEDLDALIDKILAEEPSDVADELSADGLWGADGGAGDDYIDGGHGEDAITGGAGDDTLRGNLDDDFLFDAEGSDALYGGYGDDVLMALDDSDTDTPDILDGGANDDVLFGDDGDTMTGGDGLDSYAIVWDKGDAPVMISDFLAEQTVENTAGGTLTTTIVEDLTIQTDSWSDDQTFTVEQSGDDVNVSIDGDVVATLQGVDASLVAGSVSLYNSADGSFIDATLIQS